VKLGKLIEGRVKRDAVHVAIAPLVAGEELAPGQHIGVDDEGYARSGVIPLIGVVDPFLRTNVNTGGRFWILLYPETVTSLRHEWSHPILISDHMEDEKWLRDFCSEYEIELDKLIRGAVSGEGADFRSEAGKDYMSDPHNAAEVWLRIERLTGEHFSQEHRESTFFGCGC